MSEPSKNYEIDEESGFSGHSSLLWRLIIFVLAVGMVAVGLYLTSHYYDVHFPKQLTSGSLCDISFFWNCDVATLSPLASFASIPTSVFGIGMGLIFALTMFWFSNQIWGTLLLLSGINLLGCFGLFLYSLLRLGGLCPGCTLYYLMSLLVFIVVYMKFAKKPSLNIKLVVIYSSLFAVLLFIARNYTIEEEKKIDEIAQRFIEDFKKSPNLESFKILSPFRMASATENFYDAPLRVSIFSDFQCPVCKVFAEEMLPKLIRHFKGKMNLQYFAYPMDSNCNHNLSRQMHPIACSAAYLSTCFKDDFVNMHDQLYFDQQELSEPYLQDLSQKLNISKCFHGPEAREFVDKMILDGDKMGVNATPTLIVNGRKLEGLLPLKFFIILFEESMKENI